MYTTPSHTNTYWHSIWILGISVICSAIAVLSVLPQPKVSEGTYVFEYGQTGEFQATPLEITNAPEKQSLSVVMNVQPVRNHRTNVFISSDDCVTQLKVNGQEARKSGVTYNFCDHVHKQSFTISEHLQPGDNSVEMMLLPIGRHVEISMQAQTRLWEYLVILIIAIFFSRYLRPYLHPNSSGSVLRKLRTQYPDLHRKIVRIAKSALLIFLCTVCVIAVWKLWQRIAFEMQGPFNADSSLYWAVGKGMLNGLVPYTDLFETKPPGIFIISAFSYWLTGGPSIGYVIQALSILGFPLILLFIVLRKGGGAGRTQKVVLLTLSLVFGIHFSLYASQLAGAYQVESLGAFFGSLYIWILAISPKRMSIARTLFAASCILIAIGLKEPFLLTITAAGLLFINTKEDFLRRFLVPLGIAAVAGFIIMLLLGYLGPYVRIYLPEMLGRHIHMPQGSLWVRGLHVNHIWFELLRYSPFLLWSVLALSLGYIFLRINGSTYIRNVCSVISALYLLTLAVGMGGQYVGHHFVFALPVYFALFVMFVQFAKRNWDSPLAKIFVTVLMICGALSILSLQTPKGDIPGQKEEIEQQQKLAYAIDSVLDRCSEERYLFLGGNGPQPYAYTDHSPLGPLFFQYDYLLGNTRKYFRESFMHNLARTDIVVIHSLSLNDVHELTMNYLEQHFIDTPWPCAQGVVLNQIDPRYRMVFRVSNS